MSKPSIADKNTRSALQRLEFVPAQAAHLAWSASTNGASDRERAGWARQRVLDNLSHYLRKLEQSAMELGVNVHWADGAQDANRQVVEILRQYKTSDALRNHNALLDEIALDRACANNGIKLTHLHPGDHIAALASATRHHPVWPVVHLRAEEISEVVSQRYRVPRTHDPDILASTLRGPLRRTLLRTNTVLLGLDFAVAGNGALVCIDNDGHNANMVALARQAICLLSIENITADMADLHHLANVYARSAWGREMPAYLTSFDRPTAPGVDGPREIHLIFVDNRRSNILNSDIGEALRCIGCGACHNVCPVYQQIGGEAYGESPYSGPIGALINPILLQSSASARQPYLSSACAICKSVCPVNIDLPGLLNNQRQLMATEKPTFSQRLMFGIWRRTLTHPRLFRRLLRVYGRLRGF